MAQLIRQTNWSESPIGAIETWPQSLRTSLSIILNSAFPMFVSWGPARVFFYNDAYIPVLGGKHPAAIGKKFKDLWSDIWIDIEPFILQVDRGESVYLENRRLVMNRYGHDEETFFTFSYSPVRDESNKVGGLFCACVETTKNIREFAEAERNRRDAEAKEQDLRFALSAGLMGTWTVDLKSSAVTLSEEALRIFGSQDEDLAVESIIESVIHPDDQAKAKKDLEDAIVNQTLYRSIYRIQRPSDGELRWILATGQTRLDQRGQLRLLAGVVVDISEQKFAELELERAKEEAERANASKSAFLANMSHEIRTPMSAVLGFTEILRDAGLRAEQRIDAINRIDRSGRSLLKLIDDILDISRVEAGRMSISKNRFSPLEVTTEVIALLRLQAEQKGLTLNVRFRPNVPEVACSDAGRLRQILTNVIGNAIKFTLEGEVSVVVSAETAFESQFLNFHVTDTGIGISNEDRQKLFQPFAQADPTITRKFGGSGLGLILSKRLAEQLGGDLKLESSELGRGSTMTIKIEAGPFTERTLGEDFVFQTETDRGEVEITKRPILDSAKILVVDDVPDNQHLMRRFLEGAGAIVDVAGDGEEAIKKALSKVYDVILMDIQMPVLDGVQATQKLRAQGYDRPILALTAHAMKEEVQRSLSAGCNEHLTKPITKQSLITAVYKFVRASDPT